MFDPKNWTYGVEHEFADWHKDSQLPPGCTRNTQDHTIVNSNGIAADPKGKVYSYGGEINTRVTNTPQAQGDILRDILYTMNVRINYRSNLHIHIRVPRLRGNLPALKTLAKYNFYNLPKVLPLIEPMPVPTRKEYPRLDEYEGARRRFKRRKVSHQTIVTSRRLKAQLSAHTVLELFKGEVPTSKKHQPLWHLAPRHAVNLRQLRDTNTIEFRHFPGTLNPDELITCIEWCRDYLISALITKEYAISLYGGRYVNRKFPKFMPYNHGMEKIYRQTCHDGSIPLAVIKRNIERILS